MRSYENLGDGVSLLLVLLAAILSIFLTYVWLVLPLTIARKLDDLRSEAKKQTDLLEEIAAQGRKPGEKQPSSVSYRIPGL